MKNIKILLFLACALIAFNTKAALGERGKKQSTEKSLKPDIWILTDFTGIRHGENYYRVKNDSVSKVFALSDADDYVALSMYLMNANRFNTVRLVLGSNAGNPKKCSSALRVFDDVFLPAYKHDVQHWNAKNGQADYPSTKYIRSVSREASTQGKFFGKDESYASFNTLPPTVQELVLELKKEKYSAARPLYVSVWGPLTEVAMAVKHLAENNDVAALERLFVVSHWTTSHLWQSKKRANCIEQSPDLVQFNVSNCREDCEACVYVHEQAANGQNKFRFVDVGALGQLGIVEGVKSFFQPGGLQSKHAYEFRKSKMGEILIRSKFEEGSPDGSDCAAFFVILGDYGLSLADFNNNGVLTVEQEMRAIEIYKNNAHKIYNNLLKVSQYVSD